MAIFTWCLSSKYLQYAVLFIFLDTYLIVGSDDVTLYKNYYCFLDLPWFSLVGFKEKSINYIKFFFQLDHLSAPQAHFFKKSPFGDL